MSTIGVIAYLATGASLGALAQWGGRRWLDGRDQRLAMARAVAADGEQVFEDCLQSLDVYLRSGLAICDGNTPDLKGVEPVELPAVDFIYGRLERLRPAFYLDDVFCGRAAAMRMNAGRHSLNHLLDSNEDAERNERILRKLRYRSKSKAIVLQSMQNLRTWASTHQNLPRTGALELAVGAHPDLISQILKELDAATRGAPASDSQELRSQLHRALEAVRVIRPPEG